MAATTYFPSGLIGRVASYRQNSQLRAGLWGIADQGLVSMTNFVTMILLARSMSPAMFGGFVLLYTALLFANNLQTSLVTRPHNVLAASLGPAAFASFTGTALLAQVALATAFANMALLGAGVLYALGSVHWPLLLALAAAVFAWQMQEFVRQVAYTKGHADTAFAYDVVSYAGQVVVIIIMWDVHHLTETGALLALASTSAASAVWGLWRLSSEIDAPSKALAVQGWRFGRWLLGESIGQWLSSQALPLLTAVIVGVSATGVLKAVQNLIAPGHIIMNSFQAFAIPRAARAYQTGGRQALFAFLVPVGLLATAPLIVFWLSVGLMGPWLLDLLYGNYHTYAGLVWLTTFAYLLTHLSGVWSVGLLATGNTRAIFAGRLAAIGVTFTVAIVCIWQFGVQGALYGSIVAHFVLNLVLGWYVWRSDDVEANAAAAAPSLAFATTGGES